MGRLLAYMKLSGFSMHLNKTVYKLPSALAVVDIDWLLELDG